MSSLKALVVDDSIFTREKIKEILLSNGFSEIFEAKDGSEAIDAFKKFKPDIVTMDIIMPNTSGLEALKAIRAIDSKAKIIMITSIGQDNVLEDARKLGASDYIIKPLEPEKVTTTVNKVLKS